MAQDGPLFKYSFTNKLYKESLINGICLIAGISIFFFGYDQGLMGGINTNRDYAELMGFGHFDAQQNNVIVTKPLLQGSIVAVYYLPGTLCGCFLGGWMGDQYGRISTIGMGTIWSVVGACLQCSAQNANWMYCARVFNGIGTGILNAITPVWVAETVGHTSRGQFIAMEFTLNIFGVVVAYWLEFGTSKYYDPESSFIWRFPIAFQIVPLIVLAVVIWLMPESPRWLIKVGRNEEARYILERLRGDEGEDGGLAACEFHDIVNINNMEKDASTEQSYFHMLFGIGSGKLHIGRRVQLVIWLQILQEWIGIAGITIYGPTIFQLAGISLEDRLWVTGLNNITYMFATLICVFTVDRIGRRWTLYWGAVGQGICMFIAGGLARATIEASPSSRQGLGAAATVFVFLYTMIFGATWLTVPWLYPAEIFPLQVRARGNAWGGGWMVLLLPTIFEKLNEKTLYIFGGVNFLCILISQTRGHWKKWISFLRATAFGTGTRKKKFAELKAEHPELTQAERRNSGNFEVEKGVLRHSCEESRIENCG
ncbi:hypothetical protein N7481_004989 [Penicillium waksmanii]|uniref:uncharacterized protein n=1 Tax=Penicillium waksmanii TaxID=69791 RepID=UPI0025495664|nr:uncharacterized protein N7481_004989 [Penicillium waksmanii]KAJ5982890.1 hypothetical protein N7481_004989 [Penicillium waksmanii]